MFRTFARSMVEPHPFARNPISMAPHAWRAGDLGKKLVKTSAVYVPQTSLITYLLFTPLFRSRTNSMYSYFPFYAIILGWPLAAASFYNGRM